LKDYNLPKDEITFLRQLFGENRAEWSEAVFSELFVPPSYLKKLQSSRPSLLVGGRGTGKTTALQSLKYEETLARLVSDGFSFSDQQYLGILIRMNKNRVHAFKGAVLGEEQWNKCFAHYFNLIVCKELAKMAGWLQDQTEKELPSSAISAVSEDLGLGACSTIDELIRLADSGISALQLYVNNPHNTTSVLMSMPESPLRVFVEALEKHELLGERVIFCCIDEYENLLNHQQAVLNTYIKHAEPPLSYKVGVRRYGLRNHQTLDVNDLLKTPDDYGEIQISDEGFDLFATGVANKRLEFAKQNGLNVPPRIDQFLENMTFAQEAMKLGVGKIAEIVRGELSQSDSDIYDFIQTRPDNEVYFLKYWQEKSGDTLLNLAKDWKKNIDKWATRLGNHGYASLFWVTKGKKGVRIRKYYSGLNTILALSGENIRYFLELIDSAIAHEFKNSPDVLPEELLLSAKSQTLSLRDVGRRRLDQLEGLADNGVKLKRLVLAIGKVFFELARSPANRSPETVSFVLKGEPDDLRNISRLLRDGVGHLAFEVSPRTKDTTDVELQDEEYRLHRIFTGFFEISYRKKRRTEFEAKHLLAAVDGNPSKAINSLLKKQNMSSDEELPEQLAFFSAFYDDAKNN